MRLGGGPGTPDEEGSEAEGAPSSSSGRRAGSGARRAKRPRLVWTMELNKRFLDAVMHLVRHAFGGQAGAAAQSKRDFVVPVRAVAACAVQAPGSGYRATGDQ